jgi:hypothetical protein
MIEISVIKNERFFPLKLSDNQRPTIEEFEAIFDFDTAIKGGYSMNVKIPIEGNEIALQFAHSVYTRGNSYSYQVLVKERGVYSYEAMLVIDKANNYKKNEFFDCDLIFASFSVLSKDKLLKDILTKEIVFCNSLEDFYSDITDFFIENDWPAAPVQFNEIRVIDDDDSLTERVANQWHVPTATLIDAGNNNSNFSNPTIPQPYYAELIRETFRAFGYSVTGSAFDNPYFTRQLMPNFNPAYHVRRHNELEYRTTEDQVITTRQAISWGEEVWNSTNIVGTFPTTTIYTSQPGVVRQQIELRLKVKRIDSGGKVRIYRRVWDTWQPGYPVVDWVDFWAVDGDEIVHTFYPTFYGPNLVTTIEINCVDNNYTFQELNSTAFDNTDTVEFTLGAGSSVKLVLVTTPSTFPNPIPLPEFRRYLRQSMPLGEMVPPTLTVQEFLLIVKQLFQLKIDIDDQRKTVHISLFEDIKKFPLEKISAPLDGMEIEPQDKVLYRVGFKNESESIKDLLMIGSVPNRASLPTSDVWQDNAVYVIAEDAYYRYDDNTWKYYTRRHRDITCGIGDNERPYALPVALIEMRTDKVGDAFGILPTFKRSGEGIYDGIEDDEWEVMIMDYRGIVANGANRTKPWATTTAYSWDGQMHEDFFLQISDRPQSFFSKFHKEILTLLSDYAVVTIRNIQSYSSLRTKLLRKRIEHNNNHYIEKARMGQIGDEESINKIEMIRI